MDPFQPIYPPGFRPTDEPGGPGGPGPGRGRDPPQTVNPPQSQPAQETLQSQSPDPASIVASSMTMSMVSSPPTTTLNQPPVGVSSSTNTFTQPSQSILSASSVITPGTSSTLLGFQSTSPISTLFNSATSPISTLFNSQSVGSSGASVVTSIIALSTTTLTAIPNASASAAIAAGGAASLTSEVPAPVLRDQTIVGIALGIGLWLLIIIAALSCCLWRKRKIQRGIRLRDDTTEPDTDMETAAISRPVMPQRAPSLPPPSFLSRSVSNPLGSHPVSRAGPNGMRPVSIFSSEDGRVMDARPESPELFPGRTPSPRNSESGSTTHRSIVKMRPLSTGSQSPTSPDHISELPPSLGKLNSWLEENRRRSRMEASGSGRRADSDTLGSVARPDSRPMSLASLKEVYRKSATMDNSIINIRDSGTLPSTPPK